MGKHCRYDLLSDVPGQCLYEKISFPPDIPCSEIVFGDDYDVNSMNASADNSENILLFALKTKAIKIFNKYIKPQAEFEVNISYHGRRELLKLMGHRDIIDVWLRNNMNPSLQFKELLDLYEESCYQIFALIIDSFNRFKDTAAYTQLKQFKIF